MAAAEPEETAEQTMLPEFEGVVPVGVLTKLTGDISRITRAIHPAERGVLLVEYEVADIGHPRLKGGRRRRLQKLSILDGFDVEGKAGRRLLATMRQQYRALDDARTGKNPLPFGDAGPRLTPDGWVDASGTALSPEDVAEIQGTQLLASANDSALDPVIVVFVDGGEMRWPDEFGPEPGSRPTAGKLLTDGGAPRLIREVRDVDGFVLESLSQQDVDRIVAELEEQERAEEAAVVDELTAARDAAAAEAPWPDFDSFGVAQLRGLINEMVDVEEIRAVLTYEQKHKKRTSVIGAATARLADVEAE